MSLGETAPDLRLVDLVRVVHTSVERHDVLNENVDCLRVLLVLLEDEECLLVQAVLDGNLGNLSDVVVLELVDVADDLALVRTDSCQHEQVLEVAVVVEGRGLKDDLLKQLDELQRQVGSEESLDGGRDIVGVGALGQCGSHNLVDELTAVSVVGTKDLSPEVELTTADEVASLLLEHRVLVGDLDELLIAEALSVCDVGQVRVPGFAELSDHKRLVQLERKYVSARVSSSASL